MNASLVAPEIIKTPLHTEEVMFSPSLQFSLANRARIHDQLMHQKNIANTIGLLAENGKQLGVNESATTKLIGAIQVGEYIHTGEIPKPSEIMAVLGDQQ